ncbi:MAG: hypothetical protein AAFR99_05750 [Cyanobacteria bacterium J06629_9]
MNLADIDWGGVIGMSGAVFGAIAWYRGSVEKAYAAKRDFGHLKRNYEGVSATLAGMDKTLDDRFDRIELDQREIKALVQTALIQLGGSSSAILRAKQ